MKFKLILLIGGALYLLWGILWAAIFHSYWLGASLAAVGLMSIYVGWRRS